MFRHIAGLDHAVVLVRDLDRAAETYERLGFTLTPRGHHSLGSRNHCIMFGRDYLELMALPAAPPAAFQYFAEFLSRGEGVGALASIRVLVSDRKVTTESLKRGGFSFVELKGGAVAVGADQTHGILLVFD